MHVPRFFDAANSCTPKSLRERVNAGASLLVFVDTIHLPVPSSVGRTVESTETLSSLEISDSSSFPPTTVSSFSESSRKSKSAMV